MSIVPGQKQVKNERTFVAILWFVLVTGPALGGIGLGLSFLTVRDLAEALGMPGWPELYPIAVDVGILALLGADLMYVYLSRPLWFLRPLAWALTAFTVWANFHGGGGGLDVEALQRMGLGAVEAHRVQAGLHVVMPSLWVVLLEALRWGLLNDRRKTAGNDRQQVPVIRWFLSPLRTALLYRRMRLWGIESYPLALALEAARLHGIDLVRARQKRTWRRLLWRWQIPRLLRNDLTSGNMPDEVLETITALVAQGRRTGWRRTVRWWVVGEMERVEDLGPSGAAADAEPGDASGDAPPAVPAAAVLEGASGMGLRAPLPRASAGALEGGLRPAPGGGLEGAFAGASGGASAGASSGASEGGLRGGHRGPSGGASTGPRRNGSGGASTRPPRVPAKRAAAPSKGGGDDRITVAGLSDEEIIEQHLHKIIQEYRVAHDGADPSPTHLTKKLRINHYKAQRLLAAYEGQEEEGNEAVPIAQHG